MDTSEYMPMFLAESREHLQELNLAVVHLEEDPDDRDTLDEIFRIAHSLKGMSATMGFAQIAELTHQMEEVFELLRQRSGGLAARRSTPARLSRRTVGGGRHDRGERAGDARPCGARSSGCTSWCGPAHLTVARARRTGSRRDAEEPAECRAAAPAEEPEEMFGARGVAGRGSAPAARQGHVGRAGPDAGCPGADAVRPRWPTTARSRAAIRRRRRSRASGVARSRSGC